MSELETAARAVFTYPNLDDGALEFDGVCCPVPLCGVMSSDVNDHLIVEDDYAHNKWLGERLEALRDLLANPSHEGNPGA